MAKDLIKDARLEIRISSVDKEYLREVAKLEKCTLTDLLEPYINDLIQKLKLAHKHAKHNEHNKPTDSE